VGKTRNENKIMVEKPGGKRPLEKPRRNLEDNIKSKS
jgi:hypothetical protein